MRIGLPWGRAVFFACAFVFSLVALLPLRVALDWLAVGDRALAAREAKGSIWLGALSETQLGPVALGDLQAQLRTLPLFLGRARVELVRRGDGDEFEGAVTVSRQSFGLDDITAELNVAAAFAPLPIGTLDLSEVGVVFSDGICAQAEGIASAALTGDIAGISLAGGLSGKARCDGGAVLLPLTSQSGMESLNLRLFGDGRYQVELAVQPTDEAMRARLASVGFAANGGIYAVRVDGHF